MPDLITCADCNKEISKQAMTCPHCGAPNKKAVRRRQSSTQAGGCLLVLIGIALMLVSPFLGGIFAIVGIIILLVSFFIY